MMTGICKLFLLFACQVYWANAPAQKIFFEQLTTAEGLPSDYINCIFEDSKGFLWIGTDKGACRYDGRQFQYFSNDNGLSSNYVSCFSEDPSGNIWIGTFKAGVCKYDGKTISRFPIDDNDKINISRITFNIDGSFFILGELNQKMNLYFFKDEKSSPQVFADMAFIKKLRPFFFITGAINRFSIIEIKNSEAIFHPLPHPESAFGIFLYWIAGDKFIALKERSFYEYVADNSKWVLHKEFLSDHTSPFPKWTEVKDVFISGNELFVATANGLIYIDDNKKQFFLKAENGLGTNFIKSVYKDSKNNIYICTYGAGIKIWPMRYLEEYKTNGKVTSIFPSGESTFITTNKGVYRFQASAKRLEALSNPVSGSFTGIYKDSKDRVYIGTMNSFYKLPGEKYLSPPLNHSMEKFSYDANTGTSGFLEFGKNIYIATYGDGIFVFDGNRVIDTLNDKSDPPAPPITETIAPLYNSFAALTYNSGVTIYDTANQITSLSRKEGLLSNAVYSTFSDKQNETWIGTHGGLNLSDNKQINKTFSTVDGLVGTKILCIFRDRLKRLWALSDKYLHLFENNSLKAIRSCPVLYDEKNSINRAVFNTATNTLFIGVTDALLTVDMNRIIPDTIVSKPVLLTIKKDSAAINLADRKKISFSQSASRIVFEFESKHYSVTGKPDFFYKLAGFDDDWKVLAVNKEAVYLKLPPGEYELIAKTVNPDGFESSETALIKLEVMPPLWKRSWFMIVAAIVLLVIFFYSGNLISRRRFKQKLNHLQEQYRLQLERERIARELHDNVGSQLTYLINKIDDDYPRLSEKEEAEKLSSFARSAMQELRETIWALDKKEVHWDDLENKIRHLILLYKTEKHNVEFEWQTNNNMGPALNPLEALNIYRIIQEALNNAEKYSNASHVKVSGYNNNGRISIEINDNGKGFNMQQTENGYGLNNMRKRAEEMNAELEILSKAGKGTTVRLRFL